MQGKRKTCPYCGSSNIFRYDFYILEDFYYDEWECFDCDRTFKDIFEIAYVYRRTVGGRSNTVLEEAE